MDATQIEVRDGLAVETTKLLRRFDYAKLPTLGAAVAQWRSLLNERELSDFKFDLNALQMKDSGNLTTQGIHSMGEGLPATHNVLQDIMAFSNGPRGATATLEALSAQARAVAFNDLMRSAREARQNAARPLIMRTFKLNAEGGRIARAVVSPVHSRETGGDAEIIPNIERYFASGLDTAKARLAVSLDRTDIEIFTPTMAHAIRKGDDFMFKMHITNSEVKKAPLSAQAGLLRLICTNGMTRMNDSNDVSIRHVGNVTHKVRGAIEASLVGFEDFFVRVAQAYNTPLSLPQADVIQRLEKRFKELPSSLWEQVPTLWEADGMALSAGHTVAGLVNAMTRASQNYGYEEASSIERAAGAIVDGKFSVLQ